MSIIHRVDQGTVEWHQLRLGKPTASEFHKIITPKTNKPSEMAAGYMYRLIAERLLNEPMSDRQLWTNQYVEEGKMNEPKAAQQFSFATGLELEPVGFITNDTGTLGCSPDRLVIGRQEAVEIKCPQPWTQIGYLLDAKDDKYWPQVQGQMLIGEFECVHFFAWHPQMPPKHKTYERDDGYMTTLEQILGEFCKKLDEETEKARDMGAYVAKAFVQQAIKAADAQAEYLQ